MHVSYRDMLLININIIIWNDFSIKVRIMKMMSNGSYLWDELRGGNKIMDWILIIYYEFWRNDIYDYK